jgi:hypothetical protein
MAEMPRTSLFAHLIRRFSSEPEDLATEALAFVLEQSPEAGSALIRLVRDMGAQIPSISRWATQVASDDDARPDLVGFDDSDATPLILESKFWAGLTNNQPSTYLKRLPRERPGCLLVVAPAVRAEFLWSELLRRAGEVGQIGDRRVLNTEVRSAQVGENRLLGLVSWRALLTRLGDALSDAGDAAAGGDLRQLAGLCEEMDTEAFLPLRSEELTASIGSRLVQLHTLVDDTVTRMADAGLATLQDADGKALWSSAGSLYWGRYMNIATVTYMLRLAPMSWGKHRATPIWLQVGYRGSPSPAAVAKALEPISDDPGRVVTQTTFVDVAIDLPIGEEREAVMESIVDQICAVAELLQTNLLVNPPT